MARPTIDTLCNLTDRDTKRKLQVALATLQGVYEVKLMPRDPRRGDAANRYFHGVVLGCLRDFLNSHDEEKRYTLEEVKELVVVKCLGTEPIVNPATGEVIGEIRKRTSTLSKAEFGDLIEAAIKWLGEQFSIEVPDPSLYIEPQPSRRGLTIAS